VRWRPLRPVLCGNFTAAIRIHALEHLPAPFFRKLPKKFALAELLEIEPAATVSIQLVETIHSLSLGIVTHFEDLLPSDNAIAIAIEPFEN
jgi:hypothetical protein